MTLAYVLGLELVSALYRIVCFAVATVARIALHMEVLNSNKVQLQSQLTNQPGNQTVIKDAR